MFSFFSRKFICFMCFFATLGRGEGAGTLRRVVQDPPFDPPIDAPSTPLSTGKFPFKGGKKAPPRPGKKAPGDRATQGAGSSMAVDNTFDIVVKGGQKKEKEEAEDRCQAPHPPSQEACRNWAVRDECKKNPVYMSLCCQQECDQMVGGVGGAPHYSGVPGFMGLAPNVTVGAAPTAPPADDGKDAGDGSGAFGADST